jgi:peroxiredoxin
MTQRALVFVFVPILFSLSLALGCTKSSTGTPKPAPASGVDAAPPGPARLDPPAGDGAMGINLMADGDRLYATWLEPVAKGDQGAQAKSFRLRLASFVKSAWSAPVTVTESASLVANWADFPSLARSAAGALIAHVAEEGGGEGYDVVLYRSDDGTRWSRLGRAHDDATDTEHGFVSLLPDDNGVRAFWLDGREQAGGHGTGAMALRTAVVGDGVTHAAILDARVCDCCGTSAAMTSDGPVLVYRDRGVDEARDIAIVRLGPSGAQSPRLVYRDGWRVAGCPVNGPAVAADGRRVVVAWYTYAESRHRVRLAFSEDAGQSFAPPIEVDGPRGRRAPLGRVDVVLLDKDAIVSWIALEREDAALLARRAAPGGALGKEVTIAPTRAGRDSGFPRMERLGDTLVFAWTEVGKPSHVRVASMPIGAVPVRAESVAEEAVNANVPQGAPLALGARVPDVRATTLDGKDASLEALRGQAVLVNVWATWCEPCRQELPELATLHARYQKQGLRVVGVSVDKDLPTPEVAAFVARRKLPFAVWHDAKDQLSRTLGVTTLPVSFVVDKKGTLVWRSEGAVHADDKALLAAIDSALAPP